jgi:hypothetical protein
MKRARHQSINRPVTLLARRLRRRWVRRYPGRPVPILRTFWRHALEYF